MVFKKYSHMKLQMKREALQKLNRHANELGKSSDTPKKKYKGLGTVLIQLGLGSRIEGVFGSRSSLESKCGDVAQLDRAAAS
jgi:hypothetical protein